jgi:hypothetical protein
MLLRKEPEQEDVQGWKSGHLHALCTLLRYYYKIRTRHPLINRRSCSRPRIKTITSRTGFYGIKKRKTGQRPVIIFGMEVLQTSALPLGYAAKKNLKKGKKCGNRENVPVPQDDTSQF